MASSSYAAIVAIALLWGLLNHFGLNALITRLAGIKPSRRGAIMGLNSAVTYLSVFAGTLGFAPVYALGGFALAALLAGALTLLAAALAAGGSRRAHRDNPGPD